MKEGERNNEPARNPERKEILEYIDKGIEKMNYFLNDFNYDYPKPDTLLDCQERKALEAQANKEALEKYNKNPYRINNINAILLNIQFYSELCFPENDKYFMEEFNRIKEIITQSGARKGKPMPAVVVLRARGLVMKLKHDLEKKREQILGA